MRVEVNIEPLDVQVNALELVIDLADTMPELYAGQFERGLDGAGKARPQNKKGQPLGQGSGGIAANWWTETPSGNATLAGFSTGPDTSGGRFYAVRRLVELGSSPVSSEGSAAVAIDRAVQRGADRAVGL